LQPGGHRFDPGQLHQKIQWREFSAVEAVVLMRAFKFFWILMIPIALVVVGAVTELVKMIIARRERQALIERGIDPDTVAKKAPTLR
jgi:hypothetical protein